MNNMKLYIVGMVLAVMSLTACTAGRRVMRGEH